MGQLSKGKTWASGDTVTASDLNNMVDLATAQPGIVGDQTADATPVGSDEVLVRDASTDALRKVTVDNLVKTSNAGGLTATLAVAGGGTGGTTAAAARTGLGLGTAAVKDSPSSGDASTSELVQGDDTRLTNTRAPSAHNHSLSDVTDSGTAASKSVPASGDASSTEVVLGSDTRLTDSRTAVAHTHVLSEVTDSGTAAAKDVPASGDASTTEVVLGTDTRLTDVRTPADASVTNAKVATGAAIAESKLGLSFATHANTNDPTGDEKSALAGTSGSPSGTNKFVTDGDSRLTDSRAPSGTATGDLSGSFPNPTVAKLQGTTLPAPAASDHQKYIQFNNSTGNFEYAAPSGGGDVTKVDTPADNQVGVWTGDGTIEGDADLTFDGSTLTTGAIAVSGKAVGTVDSTQASAGTCDLSEANNHAVAVSGTTTLSVSNATAGQAGVITITHDGSAVSFSGFKFAGGTTPTPGTSGVDVLAYYCESASRISAVYHVGMA